jgi:hypothetical protein
VELRGRPGGEAVAVAQPAAGEMVVGGQTGGGCGGGADLEYGRRSPSPPLFPLSDRMLFPTGGGATTCYSTGREVNRGHG